MTRVTTHADGVSDRKGKPDLRPGSKKVNEWRITGTTERVCGLAIVARRSFLFRIDPAISTP